MRILRLIRLSHKAEYCRHFKIIFSLVYHTTEELTCLVNILFTDSPQRSNVQIDPLKIKINCLGELKSTSLEVTIQSPLDAFISCLSFQTSMNIYMYLW